MERILSTGRRIQIVKGDITRFAADAICNAANSMLAGGGGVDGAIHRAGGPEIMKELDAIRAQIQRLPTGQAVATTAGKLPAKYVFHTAGPVYGDEDDEEAALLASCYRACLRLAEQRAVRSIAFPSISTGVYGCPVDEAAAIAVPATVEWLENADSSLTVAAFVLFDDRTYEAYTNALP